MIYGKEFKSMAAALVLTALLSGCGAPSSQPDTAESGLTVDFLSTGKSDCAVICMDDLVILSDTADADDYPAITALLTERGIERIDYIILSHYDKDHIGAAGELIRNFTVGAVLRPDYVEDSDEYEDMESAAASSHTRDLILTKDYRIESEHGSVLVDPPDRDYGDDNNNSMLVTVAYRGSRLLFLADARKKRMEEFLSVAEQGYDLIKLPHHGDSNKPLLRLLRETLPAWTVELLSRQETVEPDLLKLLAELDIPLLCSSDGPIRAVWTENGLQVTQPA